MVCGLSNGPLLFFSPGLLGAIVGVFNGAGAVVASGAPIYSPSLSLSVSLNSDSPKVTPFNLMFPCGQIFNIKEAVENPQIESRNMIVKSYHKVIGDFKLAGNPIKMSSYKDQKTRGDIPDLDEHREKILKEFN